MVVFFNGGNGTAPSGDATGTPAGEFEAASYYFTHNYEIVQFEWASAWEASKNSFPPNTYGNIQNAACRPATFLNYVYTNIFQPVFQSNPNAGMCAQGASAGSAAVAYSLAYYGAGTYLDNVELISGPVFSDIRQGCEEPPPASVTICGSGQYGCQLGPGGQSWTLAPTYLTGAKNAVGAWTNDTSCAVPNTITGTDANLRWWEQSIVDDGTNNPTFNYSGTGISAWLCRSLQNQKANCTGSNYDPNYCPNNSTPQGEIFYAQIGSSNSPPIYNLFAVDQCNGPEGVGLGTVPARSNLSGFDAIKYDMAGSVTPPFTAQCFHRAH